MVGHGAAWSGLARSGLVRYGTAGQGRVFFIYQIFPPHPPLLIEIFVNVVKKPDLSRNSAGFSLKVLGKNILFSQTIYIDYTGLIL
jgi:hypothetical protein